MIVYLEVSIGMISSLNFHFIQKYLCLKHNFPIIQFYVWSKTCRFLPVFTIKYRGFRFKCSHHPISSNSMRWAYPWVSYNNQPDGKFHEAPAGSWSGGPSQRQTSQPPRSAPRRRRCFDRPEPPTIDPAPGWVTRGCRVMSYACFTYIYIYSI